MHQAIFSYGIRFQEDGHLDIFPAAEVSIFGKKGEGLRAMLHLDSGATTSVLPLNDATAIGIKIDFNKKILVRGFTGESIYGYKQIVSVALGTIKIKIPVIFADAMVPRILGREGIFPKFAILFDEARRRTGFFDAKKAQRKIDKFFE
ncbi:MAG: retropepsin-like aspartic protease [bacterium]|nr:retropepsin-like aspartic protease [bacterium]